SDALFRALGTDGQLAAAGASYLRIICLGAPVSFFYNTAAATMRACGNTRTPMVVTGVSVVANAALAPLLIYGPGPLPALGVAGSALATVLAQAGASTAFLVLAARRHPDLPVSGRSLLRPDAHALFGLMRLRAPYSGVGPPY